MITKTIQEMLDNSTMKMEKILFTEQWLTMYEFRQLRWRHKKLKRLRIKYRYGRKTCKKG
jgi:hypothetical protein